MLEQFLQVIASGVGIWCFAITFNSPKKECIFCAINGAFSWLMYLIFSGMGAGVTLSSIGAAFSITLLAREATGKRRVIIGRDNHGAATWLDIHANLISKNETNNNHPKNANICYLGGHVGSVVTPASANTGFDIIDQITYSKYLCSNFNQSSPSSP